MKARNIFMHNRLVIIGAGGHGKVVADIALKNGYTNICFADDNVTAECMGFPILCTSADVALHNDGETDFVIAVGNNTIRKKIATRCNLPWATLIHPSAQIGTNVTLGAGTVVMAGAVINPCTWVGCHCIINTCAIVEHDNVIEDFAHISPNAALGGTVLVGEGAHIGIGATVKNNIKICGLCTVGAGAVVVNDITEPSIYIGVPAKKHES